jgi:hypothetical protein
MLAVAGLYFTRVRVHAPVVSHSRVPTLQLLELQLLEACGFPKATDKVAIRAPRKQSNRSRLGLPESNRQGRD